MPFPLDAKKSSAQYFAADKTLVAVLSTQFEESSGSSGAVTAQQTEEASSSTDWRVHEENEVPLEDERNKPVLSMKEAQQAVENGKNRSISNGLAFFYFIRSLYLF